MQSFKIGNRDVGGTSPCFIIAELSANHGGSIDIAKKTICAAKEAGADAIKLQTFTPDTITINVKKQEFLIQHGTDWDGKYLYDLYGETHLPWEWHQELFDTAKEEGLLCFSSPFDGSAIEFLEELEAPAYKIASPEIVDVNLIEKCALTKKPIIISTGIATESDVEEAIFVCKKVGNTNIILLKCTTAYPAPMEKANLTTIPYYKEKYDVIPGLSDHTLGVIAPVVAVSLGAKVIEKHFIYDKKIGGADAKFSLDRHEFSEMVKSVREAEKAIGVVHFEKRKDKEGLKLLASRSLYVVSDVKEGDALTEDNVRSIRPGYGLHPRNLKTLLGKKFAKDVEKGEPLNWDFVKK